MNALDNNLKDFLSQEFACGHASHAYVVVAEKSFVPHLLKMCACIALCPSHLLDDCEVCRKVMTEVHQDVIAVPRDKDKNRITVDDVNYVIEESVKRPIDNVERRVFTFDATCTSGVYAETWQNKLLKTLEEPLDNVTVFIGVSDYESLLPTVRSRCQVLRQTVLSSQEVKQQLRSSGFNLRSVEIASVMCGGSVENAQRLINDSGVFSAYDYALEMLCNMASTKNALPYAQIAQSKNVYDFLAFCSVLLMESIKSRTAPNLTELPSLATSVEKINKNYSLQACQECILLLDKAKQRLDNGGNASVVIDNLLISIAEVKYRCRQ